MNSLLPDLVGEFLSQSTDWPVWIKEWDQNVWSHWSIDQAHNLLTNQQSRLDWFSNKREILDDWLTKKNFSLSDSEKFKLQKYFFICLFLQSYLEKKISQSKNEKFKTLKSNEKIQSLNKNFQNETLESNENFQSANEILKIQNSNEIFQNSLLALGLLYVWTDKFLDDPKVKPKIKKLFGERVRQRISNSRIQPESDIEKQTWPLFEIIEQEWPRNLAGSQEVYQNLSRLHQWQLQSVHLQSASFYQYRKQDYLKVMLYKGAETLTLIWRLLLGPDQLARLTTHQLGGLTKQEWFHRVARLGALIQIQDDWRDLSKDLQDLNLTYPLKIIVDCHVNRAPDLDMTTNRVFHYLRWVLADWSDLCENMSSEGTGKSNFPVADRKRYVPSEPGGKFNFPPASEIGAQLVSFLICHDLIQNWDFYPLSYVGRFQACQMRPVWEQLDLKKVVGHFYQKNGQNAEEMIHWLNEYWSVLRG